MREIEYLKSMYPPGIKMLQNYVSEACDRMDYQNSPMYDEYPDGMMVNRICGSICDTVLSVEGVETIEKMWNIREDKVKTEELSLEDTSIQSVPGWEEMPEDFHIRHKLPDQAVYESQELINCISNDPMEVQMVRHQDSSWMENNRSNGGRPPMPPGPNRPPMPPRPTPPGPNRPPMPPRPTPPGPNRPPMPPRPTPPGPSRPPMPPRPTPPGPSRPPVPPRPTPPGRPVVPPSPSRPSWLQDMVKVLLLNEMYNRRCDRGVCML